jgi:hypothetical protein
VNYTTPFSRPLNITYSHDYRQGDCCAWNGIPSLACDYNSTILLADALTYLNHSETMQEYNHGGAFYQTAASLVQSFAITKIIFAIILPVTVLIIFYGAYFGDQFKYVVDNERSRHQRHQQHIQRSQPQGNNSIVYGWLLSLHPEVVARNSYRMCGNRWYRRYGRCFFRYCCRCCTIAPNGTISAIDNNDGNGTSLDAFINDPLYDGKRLPRLIASFTFDNVTPFRDEPSITTMAGTTTASSGVSSDTRPRSCPSQ